MSLISVTENVWQAEELSDWPTVKSSVKNARILFPNLEIPIGVDDETEILIPLSALQERPSLDMPLPSKASLKRYHLAISLVCVIKLITYLVSYCLQVTL
jgi:hypothetical protein